MRGGKEKADRVKEEGGKGKVEQGGRSGVGQEREGGMGMKGRGWVKHDGKGGLVRTGFGAGRVWGGAGSKGGRAGGVNSDN